MKKILMLCVVAAIAIGVFSGCNLLPLKEEFANEAGEIKGVAADALNAAKNAAIEVGLEWSAGKVATAAGGTTGIGGLVAFALMIFRAMRRKDVLLKDTGGVIESFTLADPQAGAILKAALAKSAAKLPIDAKKEFGV